ncbi:carbonic anhydrase [Sporosarcina pasteurii]|uniref:carbonic anhydrase n=1 Tax=Sporosarcina pasteurii TaxID=1474 RepID=A0A380CBC3_SPOPA|nr:carbonic anhydrase [Sporosarcina pasteurii]MDS9473348.1 carbonic anhydrase [Sporosarcina pasteurii]QBQ04271.1 carbonic anhydrase [Sporosarcina pasteurii]SUJ16958.1 Putative carbonate dehydratase-like protein Rv1284 [Sporosarcina pasteurii]
MALLTEILQFNEMFVEEKQYEQYVTTKFPDKRIVILTCMDTRLTELLLKSMNFKNGDVKLIKSAGAVVTHPFGGIMRSLIVAVYELQADEVFIVGHHDCGMSSIDTKKIIGHMVDRGIDSSLFNTLKYSGIDMKEWLHGFNDVTESVKNSVDLVKNHPLMDPEVPVHGLVIDPETGKLDTIINGYE